MKSRIIITIGFFLLVAMLFPFITIFDINKTVNGIPVQTLYIFGIWILSVVFLVFIINHKKLRK